ncbi:MAG: hypothetical protein ACRCSP_01995 [Rhodoglobus sp.]
MAATSHSFRFSAQQIDPLSWFTGPLVPLSLAGLTLLQSLALVPLTLQLSPQPWLQVIAILLCTSSGIILHLMTRPLRQPIGWGSGTLALLPTVVGILLSALDFRGIPFAIDQWWAPGALALGFASLAPYLSVRWLIGISSGAMLVVVLGSLILLDPSQTSERWLGTGLVIAYSPLLGLAATAAFSWSVTTTMLRMLKNPSRLMVPGQKVKDEAAAEFERVTVAQLTSRAVPFLQTIADAGRITPADRGLAGQLARRLRDDLVTQSNLSWLDSIASGSRLVIVDPDRRAQRMNNAQRTALRGMLRAILDTPGTDSSSLMIELRSGPDGATAVGVSLDIALPEGRRIMHLAPYYLTLKTAVHDLTLDDRSLLRLSFRIGSDDDLR